MGERIRQSERYPGFPQLEKLDPSQFPQHVLIIPDGNRTWAGQHGLQIVQGHTKGLENSIDILKSMRKLPIDYVTLWAFSHDNNRRDSEEKDNLMRLFAQGLRDYTPELIAENARFKALGDLSALPSDAKQAFLDAEASSKDCTGQVVSILINFSGVDQEKRINQATAVMVAGLVRENPNISDADILQKTDRSWIESQRDGGGKIPPANLLIRTKENRTSDIGWLNGSSTTLYLLPEKLFPDLTQDDVANAILAYSSVQHNLGA